MITPEKKSGARDRDSGGSSDFNAHLSPNAPAFIPGAGAGAGAGVASEGKKPKKVRAGPRKRRRPKKNEGEFLDLDTSDLLERSSQGSNASSTPGNLSGRRGRERGEKSYVPLYHYGLSPHESGRFADLTNSNLSRIDDNHSGDWLTGIMGGQGTGAQTRFRSGSTNSDRSSEWLDMRTEWSLSKQLSGSLRLSGTTGLGGGAKVLGEDGNDGIGLSTIGTSGIASYGSPPGNGVSVALEEERERKRWSDWAISAAEMERYRRIVALEEIDRAEARERLRRRRWAINAIEAEKNERLSANFLTNLTSTNWFHETIVSSLPNKDYDVVCPYYKLGCRVTCKKSDIEKHVKNCIFGLESSHNSNSEVLDEDYEVVCPNSILGCKYIGGKNDLQVHLSDSCAYKGKSRQEEHEERQLLKQMVIGECEEERGRRVAEDENPVLKKKNRIMQRSASASKVEFRSRTPEQENQIAGGNVQVSKDEIPPQPTSSTTEIKAEIEEKGDDKTLTLHLLMEIEMNKVVTGLHNETLQYWEHWRLIQAQRRPMEVNLIQQLQHCMRQLWDFASLEPFGSWATGLPSVRSDIDLVVCFEDDILLTKTPTSRIDLLRQLAKYLGFHAKDLITITKVLLHTRVPLIKAFAKVTVPCDSTEGGIREVIVELDISIDGPEHSGLATTSLSQAMLKALPGLGPVTMLLKEYLKEKGLCDAYSGGLASYGIFLLVSLLFLRRFHANQLAVCALPTNGATGSDCSENKKDSDCHNDITIDSVSENPINNRQRDSKPRGILDKNFSSEYLFADSQSLSPPPRATASRKTLGSDDDIPTTEPTKVMPELCRTSSDPSSYSFINVKQQKEYGRRVAAKLLLNPADVDDQEKSLLEIEAFLTTAMADDLSDESMSSSLDPEQPLKEPMLGVIIVEFLGVYGEELQCGRHGFSVRDGGFRFDVLPGLYTVAHPQADDPLLIEDPVNVMNNVAKNCFNALAVQKVFLEAHEKFKNVVTRYSGRAGSALAKGGSVIDEVFGISLSRAPGYSLIHDDISGEPSSPTQSGELKSISDGGVLLYRKTSGARLVSNSGALMSNLPKQLLDDIVRSEKSSAGAILGEEFRKVLHEMLLHQQSVVLPPSPEGKVDALQNLQLSIQSSPGRNTHKVSGISSNSSNVLCGIVSSTSSDSRTHRPAKKRSSYSMGRKPPPPTASPLVEIYVIAARVFSVGRQHLWYFHYHM